MKAKAKYWMIKNKKMTLNSKFIRKTIHAIISI